MDLRKNEYRCLKYFYKAKLPISIYGNQKLLKWINSECVDSLVDCGFVKITRYLHGDNNSIPEEYQITNKGIAYVEQHTKSFILTLLSFFKQ